MLFLAPECAAYLAAGFFLQGFIAFSRAAPVYSHKAALCHVRYRFLFAFCVAYIFLEECPGFFEHVMLHFLKHLLNVSYRLDLDFLTCVSSHNSYVPGFNILWPYLYTKRDALKFPFVELEACGVVPLVDINARLQLLGYFSGLFKHNFFLALEQDRYYDDLNRRNAGRQHRSLVIAVVHKKYSYLPCRHAPAGLPDVLLLFFFVSERDVKRF